MELSCISCKIKDGMDEVNMSAGCHRYYLEKTEAHEKQLALGWSKWKSNAIKSTNNLVTPGHSSTLMQITPVTGVGISNQSIQKAVAEAQRRGII
jgi:hypothetical protein